MGTNYYLVTETKKLHIGKSSGGWCFNLHVIPERDITSLWDWEYEWSKPNTHIENEYGDRIEPKEMMRIITERSRIDNPNWSEEDYKRNYAEPGPNNLVRYSLGKYCVGHGDGTYDLILGNFS